jgi:5'-AMP-activated protein kinase catalytic alpha subunit
MKLIEEEGIERVVRELKILSELNHPNIIKIYKIIEDEKLYYVVMEYCEEGELFNYIVEKNNLTDSESAFFYYQLINAIEYLHLNGIAHRDLKPENILLGENNLIKIIDFGLSNYFDENKLLSTPCGSPCYASPEMIRGENYNGADNDIWETGIILYAMLCGYLPFENSPNAKDNKILFKKILSLNLDYPNFLTDSSVDLLKRILVTDPKERIKIDEIKKHSFYLKGKKVFEQKQEYITFNELKLYNNQYNNYNNDLIATTKDNKEKFKNEYSKGYKNLFELKKYFETKEQIATPIKNKVK